MIRHFNKNDFSRIYDLGNKIFPKFQKTNNLKEILEDSYTKILVYEQDKYIIGFLMYIELKNTVDILDIIVDEKYRNKKIASCLLDYMMSDLQDTVQLITLEVRKSNQAAIHLYEKFGFEIINIRKDYYENEDAYLMGRSIER